METDTTELLRKDVKTIFQKEGDALAVIFNPKVNNKISVRKVFKIIWFIAYLLAIIVIVVLICVIVYYATELKVSTIKSDYDALKATNKTLIENCNKGSSSTDLKEGMSPAQRIHLAKAYSKISSDRYKKQEEDNPRSDKYDTSLKNPTNGRRKIRGGIKLYDNIEKAGNPTNVARGGVPLDYNKKSMQGKSNNMQALDNATFNGAFVKPADIQGGKSDIVPYGSISRMAGVNQDLSPLM